jgi:hypothetical protein
MDAKGPAFLHARELLRILLHAGSSHQFLYHLSSPKSISNQQKKTAIGRKKNLIFKEIVSVLVPENIRNASTNEHGRAGIIGDEC